MGLFSAFDKNEKERKKSHLKNLIEVALADGSIDQKELDLIKSIALKLEMTENDVEHIRKNPGKVKFSPPSSDQLKIEQINELVKMIMADRKIDVKEVKICKSLAIKLNLAPNIIDELVEMHIENLRNKGL